MSGKTTDRICYQWSNSSFQVKIWVLENLNLLLLAWQLPCTQICFWLNQWWLFWYHTMRCVSVWRLCKPFFSEFQCLITNSAWVKNSWILMLENKIIIDMWFHIATNVERVCVCQILAWHKKRISLIWVRWFFSS